MESSRHLSHSILCTHLVHLQVWQVYLLVPCMAALSMLQSISQHNLFFGSQTMAMNVRNAVGIHFSTYRCNVSQHNLARPSRVYLQVGLNGRSPLPHIANAYTSAQQIWQEADLRQSQSITLTTGFSTIDSLFTCTPLLPRNADQSCSGLHLPHSALVYTCLTAAAHAAFLMTATFPCGRSQTWSPPIANGSCWLSHTFISCGRYMLGFI